MLRGLSELRELPMQRGWLAILASLSSAFATAAPPPLSPPLDALWQQDVVLAEGTLAAVESPRLRFTEVVVRHGGEAATEVTVLVDDVTLAHARPGTRYVFAWIAWMRSPANKKVRVARPGGPLLVSTPGASPALFEASAAWRGLLLEPPSPQRLETRAHLDRALAGLDNADPQVQSLFAAELALRGALHKRFDAADRARLQAATRRGTLHAAARTHLLEAARIHAAAFGSGWVSVAADVITREAVARTPGAPNEGLVWAAFALLGEQGGQVPLESLTPWVSSGNGALAEQALLAVRRQEPAREAALLDAALDDPALAPGTRAFLLDHQRRLRALRAPDSPVHAGESAGS
jgi:hypothetical protein